MYQALALNASRHIVLLLFITAPCEPLVYWDRRVMELGQSQSVSSRAEIWTWLPPSMKRLPSLPPWYSSQSYCRLRCWGPVLLRWLCDVSSPASQGSTIPFFHRTSHLPAWRIGLGSIVPLPSCHRLWDPEPLLTWKLPFSPLGLPHRLHFLLLGPNSIP